MDQSLKPLPSPWEVSKRMAVIRKSKSWTQHALADAIGLSQSLLANIEKGRRNLRFPIGWNVCKVLNVNQWFLATGQGDSEPFIDFDPADVAGRIIPESADFAAVCVRRLAIQLECRNKSLTECSLERNTGEVKSELEKLISRVRKIAAKPGVKAELARALDVAPARVSEWLAEDPKRQKMPGGEYALRLLKWVELNERGHSSHEKAK